MNIHEFLQYRMEKTAAIRLPTGSIGKSLGGGKRRPAGLGTGLGKRLGKKPKTMGMMGSQNLTEMRYGKPDYKLQPGERFGSDIVTRPFAGNTKQQVRTTEVLKFPFLPSEPGMKVQGPPARKVINKILKNQ